MNHLWKIIYAFPTFLPDWTKARSLWAVLVSGWLKFKKSSPLKLEGIMNGYCVGMMYGRSCLKFPYFVPIIQLKRLVLVYDWQIKEMFSKTISPNYLKFVGSTYGSIFASQGLRSDLLSFTLGIVRRIFEVDNIWTDNCLFILK